MSGLKHTRHEAESSQRSKSFHKLPYLKEIIKSETAKNIYIPFITITETWLKPFISDSQVNIINYNVFRSDRKLSNNGGALIYLHKDIVVEETMTYDDDFCNAVICLCRNPDFILVCIYRPPNTPFESFKNLLGFLETFFHKYNSSSNTQIQIFYDFNFPNISWTTSTENDLHRVNINHF